MKTNEQKQKIGAHLRNERKNKGITQKVLSVESGLTEEQIIDIEKGRRNYTIESILRYQNALKTSVFSVEF